MILQLPVPPPGAIENWLLPAAAVLYIASLAKKVFWPKSPAQTEFITRSEFHASLSGVTDKIDARSLVLGEKIENLSTSIHSRLNQLEAGLARVDERTKK